MSRNLLKALSLTLCLVLLSACGGADDAKKEDKKEETQAAEKPKVSKELPLCPQVAIVRTLEGVKDFGGESSTEPDQLVAAALMRSVVGTCEFKKNGIDIVFDLNFSAQRGPRLGGLHASFPFFVAVVNPNGTVLNKELMTFESKFSSDSRFTENNESLHVFLPLPKAERKTAPDYQVLMGFQLTKEQLEEAKKEIQ